MAVVLFVCSACGGGGSNAPARVAPPAASPDGGASSAAEASTAPPAEAKPFAKTGAEATTLIDDAIEKRREAVSACVHDARKRRNDPHAKVEFDIGIDQEGVLIGVKGSKGSKDDPVLNECVRNALRGAPFPRSNAGVITVKKTFVDAVVYPK